MLHGSIPLVSTRENVANRMNQPCISKPTDARVRVARLWLVHVAFGAMDGTVSGRAFG